MTTLAPYHEVTLFEQQCELHTKIGGFWDADSIKVCFAAIDDASLPLVKARKPIFALVDFSDFVPQGRETSTAIRNHLLQAQKFGLRRLAIVGAAALVKIQYRRLSDGLKVNFFDDLGRAQAWLQGDQQP